jgi:hypothetical protein
MVLMGSLYATDSVHANHGIGRWIIILTIYIFSIAYSMTWAFGVKIFASEIQPAHTRATATALAQAANFMTNFIVAFITPVLLAKSNSGAYWLFGGASAFTTAVCFFYMPETKGRDLEAVVEAFGLHSAGDIPFVKILRTLGSKAKKLASGRSGQATERRQERGVELETLG